MPQSLSKLYIHLIFSTKQRAPLLLRPLRERVHAYLATVLNNLDSPARKVGGMSDHVHILFRMSKNHALGHVVETVKTVPPNGSRRKAPRCGRSTGKMVTEVFR
ncbi:MAG: transposase [Terriglobia bacterium]|jgi:REP element-mobilizing transposase RayT